MDFSGYFNQFHQNVYGAPPAMDMNAMMVQSTGPAQTQFQGGQQGQQEGPASQIADAYSYYDKAKSMAEMMGGSSTPIQASGSGTAAYGSGAGVYPVAEGGSATLWGGADMGASTMTGYTPIGGATTATGGSAGGTAAGSAAEGGSAAGYGAAGWIAALLGAINYSTNKDYYNWGDVFTGDAVHKKMQNAGRTEQLNEFIPGMGDFAEGGTRKLSLNPKQHAEGWSQQAHVLDDWSNQIARQNFEGAKKFSTTTLVKPVEESLDKTMEFTKKSLNPFKWFD